MAVAREALLPDRNPGHGESSRDSKQSKDIRSVPAAERVFVLPELVDVITSFLETADILQLVKTCRTFYEEFLPHLVRSITVYGPQQRKVMYDFACPSYLASRNLARHCREHSLVVPPYFSTCILLKPLVHLPSLKDILDGAPGLKTLRLVGMHLRGDMLSSIPLSFPGLKKLVVSGPHLSFDEFYLSEQGRYLLSGFGMDFLNEFPLFNESYDPLPQFDFPQEFHLNAADNLSSFTWGLESLTLNNIPLAASLNWHYPIAVLLSACPNLSELTLRPTQGFIDAFESPLGITGRKYPSFFSAICQTYSQLGARPLKLKRCILISIPLVSPQQLHKDLTKLLDPQVLEEFHLPTDWCIEYFGRITTPKLRILSTPKCGRYALNWLEGDPSFGRQVAMAAIWPYIFHNRRSWQYNATLLARAYRIVHGHEILRFKPRQLSVLPRMIPLPGIPACNSSIRMRKAICELLEGPGSVRLEGLMLNFRWESFPFHGEDTTDLLVWVVTKLRGILAKLPCLEQLWVEVDMPYDRADRSTARAFEIRAGTATRIARELARMPTSKLRFVAIDWEPPYNLWMLKMGQKTGTVRSRPARAWRVKAGAVGASQARDESVKDWKQPAMSPRTNRRRFATATDLGPGWVEMGPEETADVELFRAISPLTGELEKGVRHLPIKY